MIPIRLVRCRSASLLALREGASKLADLPDANASYFPLTRALLGIESA
jgi:hypothetical protein